MDRRHAENDNPTPTHRVRISWGAVLAGLVFIVATGWLFAVLGAALGVSIVDLSDLEAMERGFGIGTVLWLGLSTLVVFFLGSLLTAHLAGAAGMLHGVTLWSSTVTLLFGLGALGIVGLFGTSLSLMRTAAITTGGIAEGVPVAVQVARQYWADLADSPLVQAVQAALKRQAYEVLARSPDRGGVEVTPGELRRAEAQIDDATLREVATALLNGNPEQAKAILAAHTNLSAAEIESVVQGVRQTVAEQADQIEQSALLQRLEGQLRALLEQALARLSDIGGPALRQQELELALEQLDADTLAAVARYLVLGQPERAKQVLALNTNLNEADIQRLVDGVTQETAQQIQAAVETTSTYVQIGLWMVFWGGLLNLLACMLGGRIGAGRSRRS